MQEYVNKLKNWFNVQATTLQNYIMGYVKYFTIATGINFVFFVLFPGYSLFTFIKIAIATAVLCGIHGYINYNKGRNQ